MHTRTYANPLVLAFAPKFVWIEIEPLKTEAKKAVWEKYSGAIRTATGGEPYLPTAILLENNEKLLKVVPGMCEAPEFVEILKKVLGE